jgi:hypothetical protein
VGVAQEKKVFFFEKKKQKTFIPCVWAGAYAGELRRSVKRAKVFWFFFSKKNNPYSCIFATPPAWVATSV